MTTEQVAQSPRSRLGALVVLGALTVAVTAAVVAGVVLDNALGGRIRDRAIWGVLMMAVGAAGPVVALLVLVRRRHTFRQVADGRWGAVALFPGSFVALWVLVALGYGVLYDRLATPLIPYTPTFVVAFGEGGRPSFNTLGDFRGSGQTGNELRVDGKLVGDRSFEYWVSPDVADEHPVRFEGTVTPPGGEGVELHGVLVLTRKVRMRVEGLSDAALTIDDQPRESPVELEPGSYRIAIKGRPRGG